MTAFARITDEHDLILMQLPPAARSLYQWLLRRCPAGKTQEFDLNAFQDFSSHSRKRPYCKRQIRNALNCLINQGLVERIYKFNARFWKLIARHPETADEKKTSQIEKETSQNRNKISNIQASKPYSSVPLYRENRETTKTPTSLHPVLNSEIDKEGLASSTPNLHVGNPCLESEVVGKSECEETRTDSAPIPEPQNVPLSSEEIKIGPQLQAEVEEVIAPQPLNMNIKRVVMSASVEIIQNALSVVRQQKKAGRAKRPAGMLVKAIQEHWSPNPTDAVAGIPDGFNEWFNLAREKGIVTASMSVNGQMSVCTNPEQGDWQPWTELAFAFPIRILQGMNPINFRFNQSGPPQSDSSCP
ncbi:hypothetical protein HRE53_33270 (plasmid) [Acaryochloris sp. 'Moss Beach']|uniref:hypothetical protein n=1 Tax=Acaryochloris sp. 'Moss Beach' TaxID=2740837 RepID=UPI001F2FD8F9|nr:hypothetical protein [Acaryochloris sp. 'Moss Beach']UJB73474.1 hypothetical protein HRE53_33270 [Acaryochloris sp. 'Moss Beach']